MGPVFSALLGYVILVLVLAFFLQAMGGKRSIAGGMTIAILLVGPVLVAWGAICLMLDTIAGTYRRVRGGRFTWSNIHRLGRFMRGEQQRQIAPGELRTLKQMMLLTPTEFEFAVGDLMAEMGFRRVSRTGGAGDLAVDLTARDREGRTVAVQCKRYNP